VKRKLWSVLILFAIVHMILASCAETPLQTSATAKALVVATSGDDVAAGTADAPMKTIAAAVAKATPGDRIIVREGLYRETIEVEHSGEEKKPIMLTAEGKVTLEPPGENKKSQGIVGHDVGFWIIDGFEITGHLQGIKFKNGHDLVIRKCRIHGGNEGMALEGTTATRLLYEDVEIYENDRGGLDVNNGVAMDTVTFRRCSSHHNLCVGGCDGFGISHKCTAKQVRFENCQAVENGSDGFDLSGTGSGITVINCSAHGNGTKMWGANFKCWNSGSKFINCVSWATGINHDGNFEAHGDNISFINCTSGQNDDSGFAISGKNVHLLNCIIAESKKKAVKFYKDDNHPNPSCSAENCLFFDCGDTGPVAVGENGNSIGDPQFGDAKTGDFRIKATGAAAGKGQASADATQDVAGHPRGNKPSIGAFEP
jgi:hypothetical protein